VNEARRPASLIEAAAATYTANGAVALFSLVNVLVIARSMGPSGRGAVAFLVAVSMMSGHLVSLSIQEANANIAASDPDTRPGLATNSLLFSLGLGALAAVGVALLTAAVPALGGHVSRTLLWVALASIPISIVKQYLTLLVQADYCFGVANLAWLVGPVTTTVCNGALALAGAITVGTALMAWVLGQTLGVVLLCAYIARHAGFGRPDTLLARRSASFGLKAHIGRLMEVGNYRGDQWLVGATWGPHELGLYSIAVAVSDVLAYLPGVLVLVQRPDLVRVDTREAARRTARVCRVGFLLSGASALVMIATAPVVIPRVFGWSFYDAVPQFQVLALGVIGVVAFELLRNALTAQRRPMLGSAAVGIAFALTVVLDLTLIPPYGGMGAAVATAIAYSCGGVGAALIFRAAMDTRLSDLAPRRSDVVWLREKAGLLMTAVLPTRRSAA
jgi:O-antigen/teichoic acid export membrane protein